MHLVTPTPTKKLTRQACGIVAVLLVIFAFGLEAVAPFGVATTLIFIALLGLASFIVNVAHPLIDILDRLANILER